MELNLRYDLVSQAPFPPTGSPGSTQVFGVYNSSRAVNLYNQCGKIWDVLQPVLVLFRCLGF